MVKMAIKDVCRLCLTTDDLVWIFDKRFENTDDMKDIICVTTGVEITINDIISQKICKKCCQVTIKMFEFRRTSLKNDQHLREQCKIFLKDNEIKIPNTQVTIRSEAKTSPNVVNGEKKINSKNVVDVRKETNPFAKIHPSVRKLYKMYPRIKLPNVCLKYNVAPSVSMMMDQVEQYFKSRNLDFQKYTKLALKSGKVATKRTSSVFKAKESITAKSTLGSKIPKSERKSKIEVKEEIVNPIKIKLPPPPPIPPTSNVVNSDIKCESNTSVKKIVEHSSNKRKSIDLDKTEKKDSKKTNFAESLGLTPKLGETSGGALSYVSTKSAPLYICEICNSVQYSAKDLRKHQNRHLRCQFCKMKFRSLENKNEHLINMCSIKNMMNILPEVKLKKVDFNHYARRRYSEAFEDFPPLEGLVLDNSEMGNSDVNISIAEPIDSKDFSVNIASKDSLQEKVIPSVSCEVIEILSDDEESQSTSSSVKSQPPSSVPPVLPTQTSQIIPLVDNVVYNTVSIVRPDIKIKGNSALDNIDARLTDIKVLKELLTHYRPVHLYAEKNIQTELPVNESIIVNCVDRSAELKLLKPQLHVYKVPIIMKNGIFNVRFDYSSEPQPPKKLCLWSDLNVIDIKPPNVKTNSKVIPNENVNNQNILPSTATYNSTGVFNRSPQLSPTTSKFIRVNTSSLSPITTTPFITPSTNLITMNPMLNNVLQNAATVITQPTTTLNATTTVQTPNVETPAVSTGQFGSIRVKNVWELI